MRAVTRLLLIPFLLAACAQSPEPITGCVAVGELAPICGFQHPEDMELLPDGRTLLISEFGAMQAEPPPGSLAFYDTRSETITRLPQFTEAATENWGAADCTTPPGIAFSPHGIDLGQRSDGRWQILAVNHGGRESVEFFELLHDKTGYAVAWRGCALPPADSYLNDVVALPGGGFLTTHMFSKSSPVIGGLSVEILKGILGMDTGYVLAWDGHDFSRVAGTSAPFPNGIQLSHDGKTLYLNAYLSGEVRKIAYPGGELLGKAIVKGPDNSQWDAEGRLLVASQTANIGEMRACFAVTNGACGASFKIIALDPQTMDEETLFEHGGAPMGAATVAQQVGDYLYLGTFAGDRMLKVPLPTDRSTQ